MRNFLTHLRAILRRFLPTRIRTYYRGWKLEITTISVIGKQIDGGEYFIIGRFGGIEEGVRLAKGKVNRIKGEEAWPVEAPVWSK